MTGYKDEIYKNIEIMFNTKNINNVKFVYAYILKDNEFETISTGTNKEQAFDNAKKAIDKKCNKIKV